MIVGVWIKGDSETADTALIDRRVEVSRNSPAPTTTTTQAFQEWKDHLLLAVMHMHLMHSMSGLAQKIGQSGRNCNRTRTRLDTQIWSKE